MNIQPIKTRLINPGDDLVQIITENIEKIPEQSVLAIASKAFSFAENRLVPKKSDTREEKHELVKKEAEYYLDTQHSQYGMMFTIKGNWMFINAGIDESNSQNHYTLWPKQPQQSTDNLWEKLRQQYQIKKFGLIMTDSRSFPLSWGVVGHGIAHSGFNALKNYTGTLDLHGRTMKMEQLNIFQSLASAAVIEMGEGAEQQPLALITDIKQDIDFQNRPPTKKELELLNVSLEDDAYAPMLTSVNWKKGGGGIK